jgi:hypothetical protein
MVIFIYFAFRVGSVVDGPKEVAAARPEHERSIKTYLPLSPAGATQKDDTHTGYTVLFTVLFVGLNH